MTVRVDFFRIIKSSKNEKFYTIFQLSLPFSRGDNFQGYEHLQNLVVEGQVRKYEIGEEYEVKTSTSVVDGNLVTRIIGFVD